IGFLIVKDLVGTPLVERKSRDEDDLGYFDQIEHRMHTTSDVAIKVPHRNIPPHHRSEEREYLQKSLDRDTIKPSSSPEPCDCA
ncbi:hypothetical protein LSAT2_005429, partial [Lamellibrachia satsuma]